MQYKIDSIKNNHKTSRTVLNSPVRLRTHLAINSSRFAPSFPAVTSTEKSDIDDLKLSLTITRNQIKKLQSESIKFHDDNLRRFFMSCYNTANEELIKKLPNKLSFIYQMLTERKSSLDMNKLANSLNDTIINNDRGKRQINEIVIHS